MTMRCARSILWATVAILAAGELLAEDFNLKLGQPLSAPANGLSGTHGTVVASLAGAGTIGGSVPPRAAKTLDALTSDSLSTRGVTEMRVYAAASPGVVLVASNDLFGSGSLLAKSGLVITNLHVVGTNDEVAVVFKPRVEGAKVTKADIHRASVIRRDQVADLALLQVTDVPPDASPISLGSMSDIAVGADVNAIGHPTGEAWSYTKGIVSQIRADYEWKAEDGVPHTATVIQTQTPINPGNSGGPLLTNDGLLVGVNSFKGEGEGLNFAVSVNDVRRIVAAKQDRLLKTAHTKRPAECEPKSYGKNPLKDEPGTIEVIDIDCSGKADALLIVPADESKPIRLELDVNHTGDISAEFLDTDRDGKWDVSFWDTTGSGKPDLKCYHTDGNIKPTRCEKYNARS